MTNYTTTEVMDHTVSPFMRKGTLILSWLVFAKKCLICVIPLLLLKVICQWPPDSLRLRRKSW